MTTEQKECYYALYHIIGTVLVIEKSTQLGAPKVILSEDSKDTLIANIEKYQIVLEKLTLIGTRLEDKDMIEFLNNNLKEAYIDGMKACNNYIPYDNEKSLIPDSIYKVHVPWNINELICGHHIWLIRKLHK